MRYWVRIIPSEYIIIISHVTIINYSNEGHSSSQRYLVHCMIHVGTDALLGYAYPLLFGTLY